MTEDAEQNGVDFLTTLLIKVPELEAGISLCNLNPPLAVLYEGDANRESFWAERRKEKRAQKYDWERKKGTPEKYLLIIFLSTFSSLLIKNNMRFCGKSLSAGRHHNSLRAIR